MDIKEKIKANLLKAKEKFGKKPTEGSPEEEKGENKAEETKEPANEDKKK